MTDRESNILWAGTHAGVSSAFYLMAVPVALSDGPYELFVVTAVLNGIAFLVRMRSVWP